MYELSKVGKRYGQGKVTALRDVDLSIDDGEFLAIQGSTGGGKSTLLQLLGGLDRPTSGTLSFEGRDIGRLREGQLTKLRGSAFGFVFQTFNLLPTLSALENVETALVPLRVRGRERRERSARALAEVGLDDRLGHLPSQLSGGQQQRVAIARALVKEPRVVLADEPTGNLDEETRDEIMELIESLWRDRGITCVVVTHDSAVARRAQRTVWISKGRLSLRRERRRRKGEAAPTPREGEAGREGQASLEPDLSAPD